MRRLVSVGIATLSLAVVTAPAAAIPAWARKYHMNCSACHYPAPPRLNATGIRFRWAGYRMPNELGQTVEAQEVSNYIAANGAVVFTFSKLGSSGISAAALDASDGELFYAGPFGAHYDAWFGFSHDEGDALGLTAQVGGVWGNEHRYGGFKVGQAPWLFESGVAGFDRTVGFTAPLPLEEPLTSAAPFVFADDRAGGEAFLVTGRNRLSAAVFDAMPGLSGDVGTRKDLSVSDQMMLDSRGSALQVTGFVGSVTGVDTSATGARADYWRLAATASKRLGRAEVGGGLVYGKDSNLPTGAGSAFAADHMSGMGWWISGQYNLANRGVTLFGRYEFDDPNRDATDDATTRLVLGGVLPLTLPEYLRLTAEYSLRMPQAGDNLQTLGVGFALTF